MISQHQLSCSQTGQFQILQLNSSCELLSVTKLLPLPQWREREREMARVSDRSLATEQGLFVYLILLRFVRKVTQAVGGEVPVGGGGATCRKVGMV